MNFYLHIPFCRQKCPYCKFALTPVFDEAKKRRYIAHLKSEIRAYFESSIKNDEKVDTIYFGGGTPSILTLEEVSSILSCFRQRDIHTEISFESNPEDITKDYVKGLFKLGINRLSLGIQSLSDKTLKAIHRSDRDSIMQALESIEDARAREGANISINIDFILGLPYSESGETLKNIQELHSKYPCITHTSVYMLEDGLYPKEWKAHSLKEEEIAREYSEICQYFVSLCWNHYEISNWSKLGYESRHNTGYWNYTNYRGFGLSATNYYEGRRWENSHSFHGYYRGDISSEEILDSGQIELERVIFAIRTFTLSSHGFDRSTLENLMEEGLIEIQDHIIHLTPSGIFQENTIISKLIEE